MHSKIIKWKHKKRKKEKKQQKMWYQKIKTKLKKYVFFVGQNFRGYYLTARTYTHKFK